MNRIVELKIGQSQNLWKLLGPSMYSARPLFPITVRELAQNSYDAQEKAGVSSPVVFVLNVENNLITLMCKDSGVGMDEDTIYDRFLALGETGKDSGVGGFGVAKAAILGAASKWGVLTRDNALNSDMMGLQGIEKKDAIQGTEITLTWGSAEDSKILPNWGCVENALILLAANAKEALFEVKSSTFNRTYTLGGVNPEEKMLLKEFSNETTKMKIYQIPAIQLEKFPQLYWSDQKVLNVYESYSDRSRICGNTFYRVGGQTQFVNKESSEADFNIVVEVSTSSRPGDADYPFSVSREKMSGELYGQVDKFISQIFSNPVSQERQMKERSGEKQIKKIFKQGTLRGHHSPDYLSRAEKAQQNLQAKIQEANVELANELAQTMKSTSFNAAKVNLQVVHLTQNEEGNIATLVRAEKKYWNKDFLNKKTSRLLGLWASMIECIMDLYPVVATPFGVGLAYDDDLQAQRTEENSIVYYLVNPSKYKLSQRMECVILMLQDATHEVAHTLQKEHGERFSILSEELYDVVVKKLGFKQFRIWANELKG